MNKTLYVLIASGGDYDDAWQSVQGVTGSKAVAHAFMEINKFVGVTHELEIVTQEVMDGKLINRIQEWINTTKNPLCECGHRKLHHRNPSGKERGTGSCKHNLRHQKERNHQCKGFRQAKIQPNMLEVEL